MASIADDSKKFLFQIYFIGAEVLVVVNCDSVIVAIGVIIVYLFLSCELRVLSFSFLRTIFYFTHTCSYLYFVVRNGLEIINSAVFFSFWLYLCYFCDEWLVAWKWIAMRFLTLQYQHCCTFLIKFHTYFLIHHPSRLALTMQSQKKKKNPLYFLFHCCNCDVIVVLIKLRAYKK